MYNLFVNFAKFLELFSGFQNPEKLIGEILKEQKKSVATTESCTGGLISSLLTDVSGSSDYIFANFVTYSNEAKIKYLGVSENTLKQYGAVSEQTAKEMAEGLLKNSGCDFAIATTGIAGPTGGSIEKPVGLMYIGLANKFCSKTVKVRQPSQLCRRLMKFVFAKKALEELYLFIRQEKS